MTSRGKEKEATWSEVFAIEQHPTATTRLHLAVPFRSVRRLVVF